MSAVLDKRHPECGADEVFITNADSRTFGQVGWKTKRKGDIAYGTDGKPLGNRWRGAFPVFAKRSEVERSSET